MTKLSQLLSVISNGENLWIWKIRRDNQNITSHSRFKFQTRTIPDLLELYGDPEVKLITPVGDEFHISVWDDEI